MWLHWFQQSVTIWLKHFQRNPIIEKSWTNTTKGPVLARYNHCKKVIPMNSKTLWILHLPSSLLLGIPQDIRCHTPFLGRYRGKYCKHFYPHCSFQKSKCDGQNQLFIILLNNIVASLLWFWFIQTCCSWVTANKSNNIVKPVTCKDPHKRIRP